MIPGPQDKFICLRVVFSVYMKGKALILKKERKKLLKKLLIRSMFSLLQPNQFLSATVLMAKHSQAYSPLDLVLGVLKTEFEKYFTHLYLKS